MSIFERTTDFLLAVGLSVLFSGCGKDDRPPEFDDRRSELTVRSVDQICSGQTAEALKTLQEFRQLYPSDPYPVAANRSEEIRRHVEDANRLLSQAFLAELTQYLMTAESSGVMSPELLAFRPISPALEALRRFRSRMPWESSKDLQAEMDLLRPHLAVLQKSDAFLKFMSLMRQELEMLKTAELEQLNQSLVIKLDRASLQDAEVTKKLVIEELQRHFPSHAFCQCSAVFAAGKALSATAVKDVFDSISSQRNGQEAFEIAAAQSWPSLEGPVRQAVVARIGKHPKTLCGFWLQALQADSRQVLLGCLIRLRKQQPAVAVSPRWIDEMMASKGAGRQASNVPDWLKSPCPGVPELLGQLSLLANE